MKTSSHASWENFAKSTLIIVLAGMVPGVAVLLIASFTAQ